MTKLQSLKKKLIKQAIVACIALVICGSIYYVVSEANSSAEQEKNTQDRDLRQKMSQISLLEQKFRIYESSFTAYTKINAKFKDGLYTLDNTLAEKLIETLYQKHRITNLSLSISPQERFGQLDTDFTGFEPVFREVNMGFSALSDAHVFAFTNSVKDQFNGFLQFTRFDITRTRPLSETVLNEVRRGAAPAMVDANVTFLWLGIEEKLEAQEAINAR